MSRMITDVWQGEAVDAERIIPESERLTKRWRNTFRICALSFKSDAIITSQGARSVFGLAFLAMFLTITGQRKLYLVEFLPGNRPGIKGRISGALYRAFLDRACRGIQVMTPWERDDYMLRFGLSPEIVHLIPLFFSDDRVAGAPRTPAAPHAPLRLISSGKNSCDWDTLLAASADQGWHLTLVATEQDSELIRDRARDVGARLLTNIPRDAHDALLVESDLFILAIKAATHSAGQIRIMSAATYGLPVVATDAAGIRGYEQLACATFPPGDAESLRSAVNEFIAVPDLLHQKALRVQEVAATRKRSMYVQQLRVMIRGT